MAVESTSDLVGQVRDEWGVDATDTQIVAALNQRHRRMVARTGCYRKDLSIGPGVAGQEAYAIPAEVLEVAVIDVDGLPWQRAPIIDFRKVKSGRLQLLGGGGVFAQGSTSAGAEEVRLYPTPAAGAVLTATAAVRAPELVSGGQAPVVPPEFFEDLVAGAAGVLFGRMDNRLDMAATLDAKFDAACEELRRTVRKRLSTGPARIRIEW